jgi:PKD domain
MKSVGVVGTAAIVLALAAPAGATEWTVKSGGGACTTGDPNCPTLQAAHDAASSGETIKIEPGSVTGATLTKSLSITGTGNGTVTLTTGLSFSGGTALTVERLAILPSSGSALTVQSSTGGAAKTIELHSAILSGSGSSPAISVNSALLAGVIDVNGRHVTIADSGSAPAAMTNLNNGMGINVLFRNSIVKGTTPAGTTFVNTDTTSANSALFAAPGSENFHLLADPGNPAFGSGDPADAQESGVADVDGQTRSAPLDKGADEFVDTPPANPTPSAVPASATVGQPVTFAASASDPDPGDAVTDYQWDFGDGATGSGSSIQHAYSSAGTFTSTVQARDRFGQLSGPVTVDVVVSAASPAGGGAGSPGTGGIGSLPGMGGGSGGPDLSPPSLSITTPRPAQRLKRGRRAPVSRGRTSDDTGVRTVELALRRFEPRGRCRWYDSRRRAFVLGACAVPRSSARWSTTLAGATPSRAPSTPGWGATSCGPARPTSTDGGRRRSAPPPAP